jgi:isoleucyl-tRNA synthetase
LWKPVADDGTFTDDAPAFIRGRFVKDADPGVLEDLRARGVLFKQEGYEHAYPFCWRCRTPLLYYARSAWYVRTTAVKDRLLQVNDGVHWYPPHIQHGRFGNWLENNVDWAISRERYWGTPLPIWRCGGGHDTVIASLRDLSEHAGRDVTDLDPHRPFIDEVTFACATCGELATRVPEVLDTWYDSGAMPFAQWGYHPELGRGEAEFARSFPADFISEAIDQTRGWFYTLMAEGVLHFDSTAYRHVVCLGHIVDRDGRKMSKSLGNAFDPWEALNRQGADALRWWMVTNGSPWEPRRIGHEILDENVRQFLLPLWNVYAFFVTYANASGWEPTAASIPPLDARPVMDRWIASRMAGTVREARERLDAYDATGAGRQIQAFLDDLSGWYVRRCRRRFWDPDGAGGADTQSAHATLWECLVTLATVLAPFTPFVAEALWRNLAAGRDGRADSVHLATYPTADGAAINPGLDTAMDAARALVELGRRVRVDTKTKTRQPLAGAVVSVPGHVGDLGDLLGVVAEELNVKEIHIADSADRFGDWRAKPRFNVLGPRLGQRVQALAAALAADADGSFAMALAAGGRISIPVDDGPPVDIGPDDVELVQEVRPGWGVASDGGSTVAIELDITPALRDEGRARDLIRLIQDARKAAGLDVGDRIVLGLDVTGELADALDTHREMVARETLATDLQRAALADASYADDATIDGLSVRITLRRT